ncbi:MAG: glycosyltransferase family 4 protein [Dehalococcoidia bacterium]
MLTYRGNPLSGGQGVYIRNLSRELQQLGHDVTVISGPPYPDVDDGVELVRLRGLDLYARIGERFNPFREIRDPIDLWEYAAVLGGFFEEPATFSLRAYHHLQRNDGFDIVHDNQSLSYGLLAMQRMGLPVVATVHHPIQIDRDLELAAATSWQERFKLRRWYSFLFMQTIVARRLPMLITPSNASIGTAQKALGVPRDRFRLVYIGVDGDRFKRADGTQRHPARLLIVNSADTPIKGLAHLYGAIEELACTRPIEVQVVGTPRDRDRTEAELRRRNIEGRVTFLGKLDHDQLVHAYSTATVAVLPSLYEGFGLPAVEAMACELPVVAYASGALPEVIGTDGAAGTLVRRGDQPALAREIAAYLDDPAAAARAGRAGRERVLQHFTWRNAARETAALYEEVRDANGRSANGRRGERRDGGHS